MKKLLLFVAGSLMIINTQATTVTAITAIYSNGQVFLTWDNVADTTSIYKVYRSSTPITSGMQLLSSEYLGLTNQRSAINYNLSAYDCVTRYWVIPPDTNYLLPSQGLFVATSVANGSFYYAVTATEINEDTMIVLGANSLDNPVSETIAIPQPVYQKTEIVFGCKVEVYGDFISSRMVLNGPLQMYAGWLGYCLAVYRNPYEPGPHPLRVRFHAGGTDFMNKITNTPKGEINLGIEDYYPDGDNSGWLGTHANYNPYNADNNEPPDTGTNYFYTSDRIAREIKWVEANFDVDQNRIYGEGISFGGNGCFTFAMQHPEMFAAIDVTGIIFNFGFTTDYNPNCTMNTGKKNRNEGDAKLGTVATNLPVAGTGVKTYDLLNASWLVHNYNEKNFPVIYSMNGRNDEAMGWTEKPAWYDSVNNNHIGGFFFFDNRDHSGLGRYWASSNYDMFRFFRNVSYPAFSNTSFNSNAGDGHSNNGDSVGTVNGFLDWMPTDSDITDEPAIWKIKIFMHNLNKQFGGTVDCPDTCIADITPRRLQKFSPPPGSLLQWSATHLGQVVQADSQIYNGGLITIPNVSIYKDSILFRLTYALLDTFYLDTDADSYGNEAFYVLATGQPVGYVSNHTDCDDSNNAISPIAAEVCNAIDDNCNGSNDEGLIFSSYYRDADADNFGNILDSIYACDAPLGYVANSTDCDDSNELIFPSSSEICNAIDDNCNGSNDEGLTFITYFRDADGDNFGDVLDTIASCNGLPLGYTPDSTDCDDTNSSVFPGANEIQNTIDDDCDGVTDEFGVGISENGNATSFSIFPNPAANLFNIQLQFTGKENNEALLTISNVLGETVMRKALSIINGSLTESIALDKIFVQGVYFVVVEIEGQRLMTRLIVEKN